jgi:FkbH-like protein
MVTTDSLDWLPEPPDDFRERCKAIEIAVREGEDVAAALVAMGLYRHTEIRLNRLSRLVGDSSTSSLVTLDLHVLSNATTDYLAAPIAGSGVRYGLRVNVECAPFGVSFQAASDADDPVHGADAVLLALDYRHYFPALVADDDALETAVDELESLITALRGKGQTLILQTIAPPPDRVYGSFDAMRPETATMLSNKLNTRICELAEAPDIALLDVSGLAAAVGLEHWHDSRTWALAKLPFNPIFLPRYGDAVARLLGALRGRSRKLLILDLDNTLWGGVVGDDGLKGLRLGPGDAEGESFSLVQQAAKALRNRGIILAVCSKNEEAIAREAIRSHPGMVLNEEDFASIAVNWSDKPSNIRDICESLGLSLDAAVFLDDNPAERALVRDVLPMVAVLEPPDDPAGMARTLTSCGFFETLSISEEDLRRTGMYRAEAMRRKARTQTRTLEEFLQSLDMRLTFDATVDTRFASLINKTNQFNLTLCRYTESELQEMLAADHVMVGASLVDRFGDHGRILALIGHYENSGLLIDCWVMSCRVIGRGVETALLNHLAEISAAAGAVRLEGRYVAGPRNGLVADHYQRLGFTEDGEGCWQLALDGFQPQTHFIALNGR